MTIFIHDNEAGDHPSLTIAAPQSGEFFHAGATIKIEAVAVDPGGLILKVEFFADENKIGQSFLQIIDDPPAAGTPLSHFLRWQNVPDGFYQLTAHATSANGQLLVSNPVRIQVERRADTPLINIGVDLEEIGESTASVPATPARVRVSRNGPTDLPQRVYLNYEGTARPSWILRLRPRKS